MWYIDSDNIVRIEGLRNVVTGDHEDAATVKGILYELPALHPDADEVIDPAPEGAADGDIGILCEDSKQAVGDSIRIERTLYFNGDYILKAGTTDNMLVITPVGDYTAEPFTGEEFIYVAVETTPIPITFDAEGSNGNYIGKIAYTEVLLQGELYMMCIKLVSESEAEHVLAKVVKVAGFQGL